MEKYWNARYRAMSVTVQIVTVSLRHKRATSHIVQIKSLFNWVYGGLSSPPRLSQMRTHGRLDSLPYIELKSDLNHQAHGHVFNYLITLAGSCFQALSIENVNFAVGIAN